MGNYTTGRGQIQQVRRDHAEGGGSARIDLRMDFEHNGEILLSVGGVWDKMMEDFDGDASTRVVVRVHDGQRKAVKWFGDWLRTHAKRRNSPPPPPPSIEDESALWSGPVDPDKVYSALFAGGRRGGKTWIAIALCAAYGVAFKKSICWIVNANDEAHDEVRAYMSNLLAAGWVINETSEGWVLANGSVIKLESAYTGADPDAIKKGKSHFIVLNEGQKMKKRVYVVARGAIVDHSGLVLTCANPPVETKDETWVSDFAADAAAGRRESIYINFNPLDNPHIHHQALLSLQHEVDQRTFQIEVLGMFMGPADAVAYNWSRMENEVKAPRPHRDPGSRRQFPCPNTGLIDVTEELLHSIDEGDGITDIAGIDFQRIPYIGGPIYRLYAPPQARPTRDNVIAWIVDEVVLDGGDEADWCDEMASRKLSDGTSQYSPETTLIVGDASGRYQHTRRRTADSPPPQWTGKGSFDIIKGQGWKRIVPPSRRSNKNPDIIDRMRAFTSMIANALGKNRRLFADPDLAPRTCKAFRDWRNVHGKPSRIHDAAHLGDGASYPIIRLFPRILRSGNTSRVDPIAKRVDKEPAAVLPLVSRKHGRNRRNPGF